MAMAQPLAKLDDDPDVEVRIRVQCLMDSESDEFTECEDGPALAQVVADFANMLIQMGYPLPKLQARPLGITLTPPSVTTGYTYTVNIEPDNGGCSSNRLGFYRPSSEVIVLCILPTTLLPVTDMTARHEYFHATQYAFQSVWDDLDAQRREKWITEGTATAAEV